eukprot:GHVR01185891.1.p2 GENE.GHVR01185891.1~~GHVR01185891.1.p2  ORF type:complete len:107 (-),score=19.35 GHVR01185891.1:51-371(-)
MRVCVCVCVCVCVYHLIVNHLVDDFQYVQNELIFFFLFNVTETEKRQKNIYLNTSGSLFCSVLFCSVLFCSVLFYLRRVCLCVFLFFFLKDKDKILNINININIIQ